MAISRKATDSPAESGASTNGFTPVDSDISSSLGAAASDLEDPPAYISYITHPLLAEIWDNDEDAVYEQHVNPVRWY